MKHLSTVITASGSYLPPVKVPNTDFLDRVFYRPNGTRLDKPNEATIAKFEELTGIKERRYVDDDQVTSGIATHAAQDALDGMDPESLDLILVAHNYGDVRAGTSTPDIVPALAARVKAQLGIKNPKTDVLDVPYGCPGWLNAIDIADTKIRSGRAQKALVIGAETLSRISDPHDPDSMIYADGAGAVIVEGFETEGQYGFLSYAFRADTAIVGRRSKVPSVQFLSMGPSYNPQCTQPGPFLKMHGSDVYQYAKTIVPEVIIESLDKAGLSIQGVAMILAHQANQKLDEEIVRGTLKLGHERLGEEFALDKRAPLPEGLMPMTIDYLGNSSVATLPTLYDRIAKRKLDGYRLEPDSIIDFVSLGAGMHANSAPYRTLPEHLLRELAVGLPSFCGHPV